MGVGQPTCSNARAVSCSVGWVAELACCHACTRSPSLVRTLRCGRRRLRRRFHRRMGGGAGVRPAWVGVRAGEGGGTGQGVGGGEGRRRGPFGQRGGVSGSALCVCPYCSRRWSKSVEPDCLICAGEGVLEMGAAGVGRFGAEVTARAVENALEGQARNSMARLAGPAPIVMSQARISLRLCVLELRAAGLLRRRAGTARLRLAWPSSRPLVTWGPHRWWRWGNGSPTTGPAAVGAARGSTWPSTCATCGRGRPDRCLRRRPGLGRMPADFRCPAPRAVRQVEKLEPNRLLFAMRRMPRHH